MWCYRWHGAPTIWLNGCAVVVFFDVFECVFYYCFLAFIKRPFAVWEKVVALCPPCFCVVQVEKLGKMNKKYLCFSADSITAICEFNNLHFVSLNWRWHGAPTIWVIKKPYSLALWGKRWVMRPTQEGWVVNLCRAAAACCRFWCDRCV